MNTKKKTLSVLTMAATALLFAACDKDEVGGPGDSHISQEVLAALTASHPKSMKRHTKSCLFRA
jgi:uncharacterized lipoprotein YajG